MKTSTKPWSDFKSADYTPEQWHNACLIHQHEGTPTSKDQCKLPVKTPDGAVNRNAVRAATSALSGARAELQASKAEKAAAAAKLLAYYKEFDDEPPPILTTLTHDDALEGFLAHYGVKGMKWGVRRSRDVLSRAAGRKKSKSSENDDDIDETRKMKNAPAGTVTTQGDKTLIKRKDGTWEETSLSVDAERTLRTANKSPHEMSDREIKEAVNRANQIKQYEDLFGNTQQSEIKRKVEQLKLQREYAQLRAEMNPSTMTKVNNFMKTAATGFENYQKINNATNGKLSKGITAALAPATGGKHRKGN